jgi:hypothetical protein
MILKGRIQNNAFRTHDHRKETTTTAFDDPDDDGGIIRSDNLDVFDVAAAMGKLDRVSHLYSPRGQRPRVRFPDDPEPI